MPPRRKRAGRPPGSTKKISDAAFSCRECNKKFRFKQSYTTHVEMQHSKLPGAVSCDQCPVRCPDKKSLIQHIADVHEREIFKCEHCQKEFVRRAHVLRHIAQKGCDGANVSMFPCEICDATFTRKDNLIVHLRLQHINPNHFQCKHCSYHTGNFSKLIIHTQKFHSAKSQAHAQLWQSIWKYMATRNMNVMCLIIHEREHMGLDKLHCPYETCPFAKKEFSNENSLTNHVKTFECAVCKKKFHNDINMRRHVSTHTLDRPRRCMYCVTARAYVRGEQLVKHTENNTLMSEEDLAESLRRLLTQLIDLEKLECFGWPDESIDVCGARAADRERWTRVQRLRENTKQLFLYVIEDANIARMLDTHTIDQIIQHILQQGKDDYQTEADRSAERCIIDSLSRQYPKARIIGEEDSSPNENEVSPEWIVLDADKEVLGLECPASLKGVKEEDIVVWVDPLDGTSEYTQGFLEHVTVLIGISVNDKPVGGVIHQPYFKNQAGSEVKMGRTIWGLSEAGVGGFTPAPPPESIIITTTRSHSNPVVEKALQVMNAAQILRVGGAGYKASVYVFASPGCKKWDTCAPEAVLSAAGGKLTDILGNFYKYGANEPKPNKTGVLAAVNDELHSYALNRIPQDLKDALANK
ncbi:hypothetical protein MSG28_006881 [Choristoneura fumiferana]|uniref:Uncharacterized protein n=1 Tax=Choristoneura fumiferana TaxID=7141 RepID=A0ACC0JLM9_CHOFU|nr:hypothetical protein MSG28_006881 [Choristoneura fumiferana]